MAIWFADDEVVAIEGFQSAEGLKHLDLKEVLDAWIGESYGFLILIMILVDSRWFMRESASVLW